MANVTISDLALATLPLDFDNTFFELQTVEGGIDVSRKISATDLLGSGGVNSVNSGVNITVDNTDPVNPIINLDDTITLGRAILTNTNDPDLVDTVVALNVGAADPTISPHIEIGPTSIEAKSDATTPGGLILAPNSGVVAVGSGAAATPAGIVLDAGTGTFASLALLEVSAARFVVLYDAASNYTSLGAQVAGEPVRIEDSGDVAAEFIPNAAQQLYNAGTSVMRTVAAASGGLEVNNLSTGAGFERVLTTSDSTGGGAPAGAEYLVLTVDGTLTDERVFTPGTGLSAVDGGAGGAYTLNADGVVLISGSPSDNQLAVWTGSNTLEGEPDFLFNTAGNNELTIDADIQTLRDAAANQMFRLDQAGPSSSSRCQIDVPVALQNGVTNRSSLYIEEMSGAVDDFAGFGQIWVRSDNPTTLMFTDDLGGDYEIGGAGAFNLIEQSTDDTVNNTTTLAATELQFANLPAGFYRIDMLIMARDVAVSGCGLRVQVSTTGANSVDSVMRVSNKNFSGAGALSFDEQGLAVDLFDGMGLVTGSGTSRFMCIGYIEFTTGVNTFEVEFAQNTAQVGDLDFEAGSFLSLTRLN